ncbi:hypothetical protein [Radiobacillus deserti]|uniref:hypothetical protein n=1 Tax=Radiobacillus deserti TaxID=2594883 RepID=UPI001315459F|nr:hypothetical protein [Radiobacillus deserti]
MNKDMFIYILGFVMFLVGSYLSAYWAVLGTIIGISGGWILGISTYFLGTRKQVKSKI